MMTTQHRWDDTFAKLDRSCPARRADEGEVDYLRRLSILGKKYLPKSEQITRVRFADLPDTVVEQFSEEVRKAVERNLRRTDNMAPGEMRPVIHVDKNTGAKQRHWVGPDSFVKSMGQPCRRVVRINAPASTPLYAADRGGMSRLF
jgi:hypothetical protein